jgi:15-cis-phytoene synthase
LAAANIYGDIARRVAVLGESAWDRRITVPATAKLAWIARAFGEALGRKTRRGGTNSAIQIWSRPRQPVGESSS